ncbi:hypothetical protein V5799_030844, partial [Amblyomma americanum]
PLFDNKEGPDLAFGDLSAAHKMRLYPGGQVCMSIHISDEWGPGRAFPSDRLGRRRFYPGTVAPIGSCYMARCIFDGTSKDFEVEIYDASPKAVAKFKNAPVKKNEEFTLFIRNSTKHWVVHTSFDSNTQILTSTKWRNYIDPIITAGAYMKHINWV